MISKINQNSVMISRGNYVYAFSPLPVKTIFKCDFMVTKIDPIYFYFLMWKVNPFNFFTYHDNYAKTWHIFGYL